MICALMSTTPAFLERSKPSAINAEATGKARRYPPEAMSCEPENKPLAPPANTGAPTAPAMR